MDGSAIFAGPQIKPIGGNIMAHASTTRYACALVIFFLSHVFKILHPLSFHIAGLLLEREEGRNAFVK